MNAVIAEQRVGDDVEGDEQAVVALLPSRAAPAAADRVVDDRARIARACERSRRSASAWRRIAVVSKRASRRLRERRRKRLDDVLATSTPVSPSITRFERAARASATTGRPHACASTGTMPKSSSPGSSTARRRGTASRMSSSVSQPRNSTSRRLPSRAARASLRAVADDLERRRPPARTRAIARSIRL